MTDKEDKKPVDEDSPQVTTGTGTVTESKTVAVLSKAEVVEDGHDKKKNCELELPEASANFISVLSYHWISPLFWLGWKRTLEITDLWQLPPNWKTQSLVEGFEKAWELEKEAYEKELAEEPVEGTEDKTSKKNKKKKQTSPLGKAVWNFMFWKVAPAGLIRLLSDACNLYSPFLVKALVNFIAASKGVDIPPVGLGYAYALGIFLLQVGNTVLFNYFFQICSTNGLALRTALNAALYRKSLRLSSSARQQFPPGKITNMISSDAQRVEMFITLIHTMWTAPLQIVLITVFLILELSYGAAIGVGLLILLTPLQAYLWRILSTIRKEGAIVSDSRIKTTQEVLQGIRVIKFFTWENPFLEKIETLRKKELSYVYRRSMIQAFVTAIAFSIPVICASIAFVVYSINTPLDAGSVFAALSWFNILRFPLMFLPAVLVGFADYRVAITRFQEVFLAEELEDYQTQVSAECPDAVKLSDAEFVWDVKKDVPASAPAESTAKKLEDKSKLEGKVDIDTSKETAIELQSTNTGFFPLRDINLSVPKGSLVAVVGTVGSGKSSLLNGIIGEMKLVKGKIEVSGSIGYCPQQAWIQNATFKDNVLFGVPFNEERYYKAIRDCALEKDLELLQDGDLTEIGERGINLSGGQKQRVNLARVLYFDSDVVLLDDPLSAVDAHVGKYLFEKCILGAMKNKTRILVTHQLHVLSQADFVVVMKEGRIVEQGTYQELMANGDAFSELIKLYVGEEEKATEDGDVAVISASQEAIDHKTDMDRLGLLLTKKKDARNLMTVEERAVGTVDAKVWISYFRASGGSTFGLILFLALIFVQIMRVGNDFWLVIWVNNTIPTFSSGQYIAVFWAWSMGQAISIYLLGVFFASTGVLAAKRLHQAAINRVIKAPMGFFDTTPLGRIINRFSKDLDGIDNSLSEAFRMFSLTLANGIATFVLIIYATPLFAAALVPVGVLYYFVQLIYRNTSRELKRLDSISRSPYYAHFGESLSGLPTIRAYRVQDRFITDNARFLDTNSGAYYHLLTAQRWLGVRLETLGSFLVLFAAIFGVLSRQSPQLSAALIGLSLTYALQVTGTLNWCVRQFTETEIAMNAVERMHHYGTTSEIEADAIVDAHRPPKEWPSQGVLDVRNLQMKYAPDLPIILKGISFKTTPREKIGVVGRTGSGKSSLMQALFRMIEPLAGSEIIIDGVNILQIGLKDLRSNIAIIPQDPMLFSGTFRRNLDPFEEHEDAALWDALTRANLAEKVRQSDGGLDGPISEGGENLSVGQRQLLCLARAIIKKPKILVMDEATANVDYETDTVIQKCIRQDFADATILTIAHRLNTIMDYDRVMVLDAGEIKEFDAPKTLVAMENGLFKAMVGETNN